MHDLTVIGSGPWGCVAALRAVLFGFNVAVVDDRDRILSGIDGERAKLGHRLKSIGKGDEGLPPDLDHVGQDKADALAANKVRVAIESSSPCHAHRGEAEAGKDACPDALSTAVYASIGMGDCCCGPDDPDLCRDPRRHQTHRQRRGSAGSGAEHLGNRPCDFAGLPRAFTPSAVE